MGSFIYLISYMNGMRWTALWFQRMSILGGRQGVFLTYPSFPPAIESGLPAFEFNMLLTHLTPPPTDIKYDRISIWVKQKCLCYAILWLRQLQSLSQFWSSVISFHNIINTNVILFCIVNLSFVVVFNLQKHFCPY